MNTQIKDFSWTPIESVIITPEIASAMLSKNRDNRSINNRIVTLLVKEMQAQQFHGDLGLIITDRDGNLADGQHRLMAIVKSGLAQEMNVKRGIDPEQRMFIDRIQRSRTAGDVFKMQGYKNCNVMASGIIVMNNLSFHGIWKDTRDSMTPGEYEAYIQTFPSIQWWATKTVSFGKPSIVLASLGCGLGTIFELAEQDEGDAVSFFTQLNSGIGLTDGSPILALRNKMIKDSYQRRENKLPRYIVGWLIIKAWNAYSKRKDIKHLTVRSDENPPRVYGFVPQLLPNYRSR